MNKTLERLERERRLYERFKRQESRDRSVEGSEFNTLTHQTTNPKKLAAQELASLTSSLTPEEKTNWGVVAEAVQAHAPAQSKKKLKALNSPSPLALTDADVDEFFEGEAGAQTQDLGPVGASIQADGLPQNLKLSTSAAARKLEDLVARGPKLTLDNGRLLLKNERDASIIEKVALEEEMRLMKQNLWLETGTLYNSKQRHEEPILIDDEADPRSNMTLLLSSGTQPTKAKRYRRKPTAQRKAQELRTRAKLGLPFKSRMSDSEDSAELKPQRELGAPETKTKKRTRLPRWTEDEFFLGGQG